MPDFGEDIWDDDIYEDDSEDGYEDDSDNYEVEEDNSSKEVGKKKRHNKQRKDKELNTLMHISSGKLTVDQMDGLDPVANAGRSVMKQQLIIIKNNAVEFVEPIGLHAVSLN